LKTITLLINRGARLDMVDTGGVSPLDQARNIPAFMALLGWEEANSPSFAGAKKDRRMYLSAQFPKLLSEKGRQKELSALIDAGADPAALDENNEPYIFKRFLYAEYIPVLVERGLPVDFRGKEGETLLIYVCGRYWEESAAFLLEAGADPNLASNTGKTALMNARKKGIIAMLLDAGADVQARDHRGATALHHSFFAGLDELRLFVEAGADINAVDNEGFTPLMRAAGMKDPREDMMKLLYLGADPLITANNGKTLLLHYLETRWSFNADPGLVRLLLNRGVDPAAVDAEGNSAVHFVLREQNNSGQSKEVRSIILSAASPERVRLARAELNKDRRKIFAEEAPEKLLASLGLLFPLGFIGLNILAREGFYRDNPGNNPLGPVNTFITMGAGSGFAGFFTIFTITGGWDGGLEALGPLFLAVLGGGAAFLAGGIAFSASPDIRRAFADNPLLYYLPSAAAACITTLMLIKIWF
jgi:ankyrin repeat protein